LRTAIREGDKDSVAHIVKALGDTDRNAAALRTESRVSGNDGVLKTAQEAMKLAAKVVTRTD